MNKEAVILNLVTSVLLHHMTPLSGRAQKKFRVQSFERDLAYRTTSQLFRQPVCCDCISPCA